MTARAYEFPDSPEKQPGDRAYEARQRTCPACNAQPGHACTVPTDTTRRAVPWFHYSREVDR